MRRALATDRDPNASVTLRRVIEFLQSSPARSGFSAHRVQAVGLCLTREN